MNSSPAQSKNKKPLVLVITGPTASGKSETALLLAEKIQGEIISADSMQIYRGMDIGTAKVSRETRERIRHHLIDILDPGEPFSVAAYRKLAESAIRDALDRGARPILCGGTGQYLCALIDHLNFTPQATDPALRSRLNEKADQMGLPALWEELKKIDPQTRIAPTDRKRMIRALEVYELTGRPMSWHVARSRDPEPDFDYRVYCLTWERACLYRRIDERVLQMVDQGLEDEAKSLLSQHLPQNTPCLQAIGYKEWIPYLNGKMTREETISLIQQASRRYAKRQLTWFRKMKDVIWLENTEPQAACDRILSDLSLD